MRKTANGMPYRRNRMDLHNKVSLNLTLTQEGREKAFRLASERGVSVSVLVEQLIRDLDRNSMKEKHAP